jgi:hypothetical protein
MENILGKIRSREMIPTPEIVNVLLSGIGFPQGPDERCVCQQ